jgi:hypothetical protein
MFLTNRTDLGTSWAVRVRLDRQGVVPATAKSK